MNYYILAALIGAAGDESALVQVLKVIGPALVAGFVALVTLYFGRKFGNKDKGNTIRAENYKVDVEQMIKQREFLLTENQSLFLALKDELEKCKEERDSGKVERDNLDTTIDSMKKRLSKVEGELQAWEMGLKTPVGFRLIKIEGGDPDVNRSTGL